MNRPQPTSVLGKDLVEQLAAKHNEIYLLVAPPRSASTALARAFWRHPAIAYYCHEPFDLAYHRGLDVAEAGRSLLAATPIDRPQSEAEQPGSGLLVKEMTFQMADHFPSLVALTSSPVVFLLRDPRLNIASRRKKRHEGGQDPDFPLNESGWHDLDSQIKSCRTLEIPYVLLDASDFRNHPEQLVAALFERLDLSFSEDLLTWSPTSGATLGALGTEQDHWYRRVLTSERIEPATERPPEVDSFSEQRGLRAHVVECLDIYRRLLDDPNRLVPS